MATMIGLTIDEAAEYIGMKKSTIYNRTHRRTIPFFKVGNELRFIPKELEIWAYSNCSPDVARKLMKERIKNVP